MGRKKGNGSMLLFWGREVYLGFYVGERVSTCSKNIDGGPIKLLFLDPKKRLCGVRPLTNE